MTVSVTFSYMVVGLTHGFNKKIGGIKMEDKVLAILEEVCSTDEIREDMDLNLFEAGLLDSLGVIELLVEIEGVLGIKIEPTEVERDQIETPQKIVDLILK
jgi:D-alanine--poly(phosphoribitol) ligase subunit 2